VSFVAQVTLARYADRGRARLLMGGGLALAAAGMAGFALGNSLLALVVARSVMGLGSGMFLPAARRVVASASPGREAEALGRLGSAEVGGFIAGPPVAALVAEAAGLRAPFVLLAGMALALSPTLVTLAEPAVVDERPDRGVLTVLVRLPGVRAGLAIGVGLYTTIGVFETLWSRFLADLGASTGFVAASLLLFGLPMVLGMPFGGRLADRVGPQRCGFVALLCGVPLIASYGRTDVLWVLVIIAVVHATIDSVTMPSGLGAVARAAPAGLTAAGQGLYGAVCAVAAGLVAAGAAPLYGVAGPAWTWAAAALAVSAVIGMGVLLGRDRGVGSCGTAGQPLSGRRRAEAPPIGAASFREGGPYEVAGHFGVVPSGWPVAGEVGEVGE
jgi:DHA1 family inner membrane transport protein